MKHIHTFQVFPNLPEPIAFLEELSRNLWWSWRRDAIELFRRIDPRLWDTSSQNTIVFASRISQERFNQLSDDDSFLAHLQRVRLQFENRVKSPPAESKPQAGNQAKIAYFSMEFGIHESLPLFAGGLGILAGDHLKSASNMALPLVGVGLLYRQGYFRQYLNQDGWQQESYPETDLYHLPLTRVHDANGSRLVVSIPTPGQEILAQVWRIAVGRIPLILLDTNLPDNRQQIRDITARLYSGDQALRLAQEVLLGIGGLKVLDAMGIHPTVCHMNEGHCAFVSIERLAQVMEHHHIDMNAAQQVVARTTVFTTHTPVAAGHDEFPREMVEPYLKSYEKRFGIGTDAILAWGLPKETGAGGPFSMFVLGLRNSQYCNGVSKLHGQVARRMWDHVWPERSVDDVPITHITNGIHVASFVSREMTLLFERYLGPEWQMGSRRPENVQRIDDIYDEELWRAHEMSRSRLIRLVRELLLQQYGRRNEPAPIMKILERVLDPDALTIGFARRFAAYKRANLILRDPQRLEAILNSKERPVQIIFAGKAHPQDSEGRELIRELIHFAQQANLRHRIVFLEDYDLWISRSLVQGVDVWLNTPRRPMEACGTSGMKAAINGVLNLSILDGWWCEGYHPDRGWVIGNGEDFSDHEYQDTVESQALYNVLENEVIPCFYDRSGGSMPLEWIQKMKASMKMAMADYCSHRMVDEYNQRFYQSANNWYHKLLANDAAEARQLSEKHQRLRQYWRSIRIDPPQSEADGPFRVRDRFNVSALVHLGQLTPQEVQVELVYGRVKGLESLETVHITPMTANEDWGDGKRLYTCVVSCSDPGRFGFAVRVLPNADPWIQHTPGLLTWA
jgi:starch phosphorylase